MCAWVSASAEKKVQWKCCIKPLIRVEHIRIILHAQSGSCYAAACVVLLAPEFSPLICVHASACMHWEWRVCAARCLMWCVFARARPDFWGSLRCVRSSRCKACRPKRHQVPCLKIQMGLPPFPSSPPSFRLNVEVFSLPAQLFSFTDRRLWLHPIKNPTATQASLLVSQQIHSETAPSNEPLALPRDHDIAAIQLPRQTMPPSKTIVAKTLADLMRNPAGGCSSGLWELTNHGLKTVFTKWAYVRHNIVGPHSKSINLNMSIICDLFRIFNPPAVEAELDIEVQVMASYTIPEKALFFFWLCSCMENCPCRLWLLLIIMWHSTASLPYHISAFNHRNSHYTY